MFMMEIGKVIFELRKEQGLSQADLAKAVGVSQRAVSLWEAGKNEPKASYIYELAKVFNVSADYLLGLED